MVRVIKTVHDAAQEWVKEMDAIDQGMIAKLMSVDPTGWTEVTCPTAGDRVYVYGEGNGYITDVGQQDGLEIFTVKLDSDDLVMAYEGDLELMFDDVLPIWGTMWSFHDPCDNWWLEEDDGIEIMSRCGFRVFQSEDFGYFFGIDGAGYDFYEAHWIPLYKARGLRWHDEEKEE